MYIGEIADYIAKNAILWLCQESFWNKIRKRSESMQNKPLDTSEISIASAAEISTEKTGYLDQEFRLFHLKDQTKRTFAYLIMIFTRSSSFCPARQLTTLRENPTI